MKKLKIILNSRYLIIVLIFIYFICLVCNLSFNNKTTYQEKYYNISGVLLDYKIDNDKLTIILKEKEKIKGIYYLKSSKETDILKRQLEYGCFMNIKGIIKIPSNNTIPNTFNYKKYLKYNHINYIIQIDSLKVLKKNSSVFYKIKNFVVRRINKLNYSKEYVYAFLIGKKDYLDNEVYKNYQNLGITHLFAISGMHITLLCMLLKNILKKLKINYLFSELLIILILIFYSFLANFSASIFRALAFYVLLTINKNFYLNLTTIKIYIYSILTILLIDNYLLFNIGFQYSSLATLGLIISSNIVKNKRYFSKVLLTSVIATLFTIPITLNNFYEFNLLSCINNLFFVPFVSFIIFPLTIISFICLKFSNILMIFIKIMEYFSWKLNYFNVFIQIPKFYYGWIFIYYLILIRSVYFNKFKNIIYCLLILLFIKFSYLLDSNDHIYYLDVGQGDSIVYKFKRSNYAVMIDTGGKVNFQNKLLKSKNNQNYLTHNIITFFKSIGVTKIKMLILTHGDYDHMGESINLVENFKVEKVIFNCGEFNDLEKELIKVLEKKKIKYYSCIKELNIDNSKLYFLQTKEYDNENDNSNVIYIELDGYKFMFMGDSGIEKEKDILDKYNISDIDVLKVGHHGSKTSSDKKFIDEIKPKYSIISVGKNNRYGHPNKEVLDTLNDSKIYRTDQNGSIMFKIKNDKLKIETCSP